MTIEEIKSRIGDVFELWSPMSADRTLDLIRQRVNGTSPEQLVVAAFEVLREKTERIYELETEIEGILETIDDWIEERKIADSEAVDGLRESLADWRSES